MIRRDAERERPHHRTKFASDEPTLENTFVANAARSRPGRAATSRFPAATITASLRGQIAIGATNLTKQFGSFTAVKNVTVEVQYGEIYGLLGANGAGKTTTIKMLCGLLAPTSGEHATRGRARQPAFARGAAADRLHVAEVFALRRSVDSRKSRISSPASTAFPKRNATRRRRWVLSFSGLEGKEDQITGSLPGGWKQRVAFGAAIMHEPSILFLDEPTSGVDPLARRAFWTHDQPAGGSRAPPFS